MFKSRRKSALLIDFENVHNTCGGRRFVDKIDNWLLWLEHGAFDAEGVRRDFVTKEVFWTPDFEKHRLEFARRRFVVHMCRAIRKEKASSADFDLTIRAAELRHERKDLKEIVILSLDADFVSVLNHVQLHDLFGVGMVDPETKFAQGYRNIVDITIEKPEFLRAYEYVPPARTPFWRLRAEPIAEAREHPRAGAPAPVGVQSTASPPAPSQKFDAAAAAAIVCRHAAENNLVYLGRELVRKLLKRQPGFIVNGRPWSDGSYRSALDRIVVCDPRLTIEKVVNGGFVLVFRSAGRNVAAA